MKKPEDPSSTDHARSIGLAEPASAVLRLRGLVPWHAEITRFAGRALVDVLRRIDELAVVSFRVAGRDGRLHAGLVVQSFDVGSARSTASRLETAVIALAPWLEFEAGDLEVGDPLALPETPAWASRVHKGEMDDELARVAYYSPLANALATADAVVSVIVARQPLPGPGLVNDIIVASTAAPTDVLASLLVTELSNEVNIEIETAHGSAAIALVESHHRPAEPLELATFADIFSLPARARGDAAWQRYPARPRSPEAVLKTLTAAPSLHRWVLGRTGMGKTTLLEHLIVADAAAGKPVVVIDPHGGLADSVRRTLPAAHQDRLVYADFAASQPPTLNPLVGEADQDPSAVTAEFVEIVRNLWDDLSIEMFGPIGERILRTVTEAVIRFGEKPSMAALLAVLQGESGAVTSLIDAAGPDFAQAYASEMSNLGAVSKDGASSTMSLYVVSKLAGLVSDARVRRVVDGPGPGLSLTDVVEQGRILVVRAPVGLLNLAGVRAISQLVISRLLSVLGHRFEQYGDQCDPVAVYIDEWALVAEAPIQRILAEGRKFGFELTIANQSIGQIRQPSRVAGNVGTLALFRVGPAESELFAPEFAGIDAAGLRLLPPHHLVVRPPDGDEVIGAAPSPLADVEAVPADRVETTGSGNHRTKKPGTGKRRAGRDPVAGPLRPPRPQ